MRSRQLVTSSTPVDACAGAVALAMAGAGAEERRVESVGGTVFVVSVRGNSQQLSERNISECLTLRLHGSCPSDCTSLR